MRKSITFIMALAMILGMSQCKKNVKQIATPSDLGEAVYITLYVGGDDGKHIVHPNTGAVEYTDGDVIYVGNNGKYIGYLEYDNGAFSGTIYGPSTDDYLHFYFVGGLTPSETPVAGTTTSFSVDLSDQSSQIPTLSYVHTTGKYDGETTTYTCMLLNKCGLVKFNLANTDIPASTDVAVMGMNNAATVHFDGEPFTYSTNGDGTVILNAVSAQERWAVLPVQSAVSGAVAWADGYANSETFTVPPVTANMYNTQGVNIPAMAVASKALTFEAKDNRSTVTVSFKLATVVSMQYSTDGTTWNDYTSEDPITLANVGDKVMFRAPSTGNTSMCYYNGDENFDYSIFAVTGDCYVYGNVMSLLYKNYGGKTAFPSGSSFTFVGLFRECASIYNHPTEPIELPATTLADFCYIGMFAECTNLTEAPALPAATLTMYCYSEMFSECTSLTTAPVISATTLAESCCYEMFWGCTNLVTPPALPAMTMAENCYGYMFLGCTNLTEAPALPATTLAEHCYGGMFDSCTGLETAPALNATNLEESCYSGMFFGCTSLETAPVLPATTLADGCYAAMFSHCTGLTEAPVLPAETLAEDCYGEMFSNCTGLNAAPNLPATTLFYGCYSKMFSGCTGITETPVLGATTLVSDCYHYMFIGCSSLNKVTCLATNPNTSDCSGWLSGVAEHGTFYKDASVTTWPTYTDSGIPKEWTVENINVR